MCECIIYKYIYKYGKMCASVWRLSIFYSSFVTTKEEDNVDSLAPMVF